MKNRLAIILFIGIAVLLLSAVQAFDAPPALNATVPGAPPAPPAPPEIPADMIHVVTSDYAGSAAVLGGTVIPYKMVNLLAQWKGEVKTIAGQEGDAFKKGARIVALDDDILQAKRRAAVAGLRSAQAGVGNALIQLERERRSPHTQSNSMLGGAPAMFTMFSDPMRSFSGKGSPRFERHSNLYGQGVMLQTARDQVDQAMAGLAELDKNIADAVTVAPFDGVIVKKMVQVGDTVNPGMPLLVYADTRLMQIQVEVPTRLIGSIREGDTVMARLDHHDNPVTAVVSQVFPMANMGGHTTTVKFDLPADIQAHAGMYAEIIIENKNDQAANKRPMIPESAIIWRGSLPAVFKISEDQTRLKMRTIRLGGDRGDGRVIVLSGLSVGDRILKAPLASTRSGPYRQMH
ncbi:MAG: efflux RND transporter periplasmic adaptor subunit [Pseudomonadota bacterium]